MTRHHGGDCNVWKQTLTVVTNQKITCIPVWVVEKMLVSFQVSAFPGKLAQHITVLFRFFFKIRFGWAIVLGHTF